MRIIKYNRTGASKAEAATYQNVELAQQVASLSNQLNDWFTMDNNGVLVSNYSLASTSQVSSNYIIEQQASIMYDSKIEYLEISGYIDTGIVQNLLNYELNLQMQWIGTNQNQFETFVGYMDSSLTPRNGFHKYQGKWMLGTNTTNSTSVNADNNEHLINIVCSGSTESLSIDGTVVKSGTVTATGLANNTLSFFLGARNRGSGNIDNQASVRLMGFSYKEFTDASHQTINKRCELIPVRVGTTGYMYDKVSKRLLSVTGTTTLGSDIV